MKLGDKVTWSRIEGELTVVDMVVEDPEIMQVQGDDGKLWYVDVDELTAVDSGEPTVKEKAFETLVKAYEMYLGHEPDRELVQFEMDKAVDERGHLG